MNFGCSAGLCPSARASSAPTRDHPDAALALERRLELVGAESGVGDIEIAFGIEAERIAQDDRAAVDLLEQRALAGVDLAQHLAVVVEGDQLGAQPLGLLDHLALAVDQRRGAGAKEDRAGRKLFGGDRQHAHAERPGQAIDQLLLDHEELARGQDLELADVTLALRPAERVGAIADLGRIGDEQEVAVGAEDRALGIVERLDHLQDHGGCGVDVGAHVGRDGAGGAEARAQDGGRDDELVLHGKPP